MLTSPPQTPQRSAVSDGPHNHLRHVTDFDTGGEVNHKTRLKTCYLYNDAEVDNKRLRNISGKTEPRLAAQMIVKAGDQRTAYPPFRDLVYDYKVWLRFDTLYSAPAVRIEIEFSGDGQDDLTSIGTLVLEYPFNDRDGKRLRNLICDLDDGKRGSTIITFEANGATSEGCHTLSSLPLPLSTEQESVIEMFKTQCMTNRGSTIVLVVETRAVMDFQSPTYKVLAQLAGGAGSLLPPFEHREWDDFLPNNWQNMDAKTFMRSRPSRPNLMLIQDCGITFSSVRSFCATHAIAETIANEEGAGELRRWARADHQAALYEVDGQVVLTLKHGDPIAHPSGRKNHPKIPNDLEVNATLSDGIEQLEVTASHERDMMGLPSEYDSCYKSSSHSAADLLGLLNKPNDQTPTIWHVKSLIPHENSFWVDSVLQTARTLCNDTRWHPFMLGQCFDSIGKVDVIATVNVKSEIKASAERWFYEAFPWNPEQRRVLDSLQESLDGMVICTGFPGTGKTTLLLASAVYLVKLGGRALVSAAENGHIENMANILHHMIENVTRPGGAPIRAYIVQSASRSAQMRDTNAKQATRNKKGHVDGGAGGIENFTFALLVEEGQRDKAWQYTLCNAVAEEANKGELILPICRPESNNGELFDAWERLRMIMRRLKLGTFPWKSEDARAEFKDVYYACEGQVVSEADILIVTACNARCRELRVWGASMRESGVNITTFGVFIDNADSCRAMEFWNVVASCALRPDLVMVAGDAHVLGPVNTSINQKPRCNQFALSLSTSEFERFTKLGFPVLTLTEQRCMNSELIRFLSLEFYNNELSTAPGRDSPLPLGFREALLRILSHRKWPKPEPTALGEKIRLCYLEVRPEAAEFNERKSIVMLDYVEVFFASVFPALQEYFRENTSKELLVIVAYAYARTKYTECMHGLQEEQGLGNDWYPRIMSVDGSKGHTAAMAFFDGSMERGDRMGFLKEPKRCNVAMTRATEVFWAIGGPLLRQNYEDEEEAPFYKLREQLAATGQVIDFPTPKLTTIDRLTAKAKVRDGKPSQRRDVALRPKKPAFRR